MRAHQQVGVILVAACALAGATAHAQSGRPTAAAASVSCPAGASAPATVPAPAVQWEFSELGSPTPASSAVSSSWTRGGGSWSAGRAAGTICSNDSGGGLATRELVLKVSGSSKLSPQITKLGMLGVQIVLPVTVTATNDTDCPRGTSGSVTLFASYYGVHKDSIVLHFAAACSGHDHTFTGSIVRVLIARGGHQVNTASA